ncbi:hypothetical protein ACFT54_10170 [Streptomyces cinereoruber]|uniref:hypothetical protein n=1 Tax=Streptomyces cinereoruber TaxID=67260 RepID=UPI003626374F
MAETPEQPVEPQILIRSEVEHPCPECGQNALGIVTAFLDHGEPEDDEDTERKAIGGWALCGNCHHAPHPVMDRGDDG